MKKILSIVIFTAAITATITAGFTYKFIIKNQEIGTDAAGYYTVTILNQVYLYE
jgi:hypothetical protein